VQPVREQRAGEAQRARVGDQREHADEGLSATHDDGVRRLARGREDRAVPLGCDEDVSARFCQATPIVFDRGQRRGVGEDLGLQGYSGVSPATICRYPEGAGARPANGVDGRSGRDSGAIEIKL
jgi:hypothetical protein